MAELLEAADQRTFVVLISSFPYAINWTNENVPEILQMAHSSQEEGNALADVLFGDLQPRRSACTDVALLHGATNSSAN